MFVFDCVEEERCYVKLRKLPSYLSNLQVYTSAGNLPPFSEEFAKEDMVLKISPFLALRGTEEEKVDAVDILM